MGEPATSGNADSVSIHGLDELYTSTVEMSSEDDGHDTDPGWSLTEAAMEFGVSDRTVRRWIKQHRLSAWKVEGPRGPEWRVQPGTKLATKDIHSRSTVDNPTDTIGILELVRELQNSLDAAQKQLQGASFRNGYLESQVDRLQSELESHRETIKLLTDRQHKSRWWRRFGSWFVGR